MQEKTSTGVKGLDYILYGGVPKGSSIVLEGEPGTGKTTVAFQFLYHGAVHCNEPGIYVTFEELPEQLYEDMMEFGWDLKQLERNNQLRVICISPEVFMAQLMEPNGLLEQMINQLGCKRIAIDSISLFKYGMENEKQHRQIIYTIRNILRKHSLTSFLIQEQSHTDGAIVPFENYVVDGVIRLTLQDHLGKFRKRTLEVKKMRGTNMIEGEHIYRITEEGIHLIPSVSMVEDKNLSPTEYITTGIPSLDRLLSGGFSRGTVVMFDTNSKSNVSYLLGSVICQRILAGEKGIILPSSLSSFYDIQNLYGLYDVCLEEELRKKNIYFIEHYNRPYPSEFESSIFYVDGMDNEEYKRFRYEKLESLVQAGIKNGEKWFVYYDLNTILSERGKDFVIRFFAEEAAWAKALGITLFVFCNFAEIGEQTASFLQRTSNKVIRTWVDGTYQYVQITKSPTGKLSAPYIVENIKEKPFTRLV